MAVSKALADSSSARSQRPDRITGGPELASLLLAAGTGEGIDLSSQLYLDETRSADNRLPPCTRQGTGDSACPEIDVLERSCGDGFLDTDVGDRHTAARSKDPTDLLVDPELVGAQIDDAVGDDDVGPLGLDR